MSIYEAFNYGECVAWLIIAITLPFWLRSGPAEKRGVIQRASITLIVFGISDYFEAPTHGRLPWWLWLWKIACVVVLLKCRYDYLGRERFRWFDRTNVLALVCFAVVVMIVILQNMLREYIE